MDQPINLTICQDCKENPAVYGDGLTWSRCAACQLKATQKEGKEEISQQQDVPMGEGKPHEIIPGLTSIILPVYMVNYALFHYTGNCIGSIREHTFPEFYELVVVDNGSPIQPPELTSYYANKVIQNKQNLGVTKAWNQGIRISQGEYIVLLNNDVQVFNGWLEHMKEAVDSGIDLVMAHPMYSLTEPFARSTESQLVLLGLKKLDPIERDFSCVMFKRSLIEELGFFDEQFFTYCSDSDFFNRMAEKGKTWKVLDEVATSHISDATGYSIADTPDIMNKDKELFKAKWGEKQVKTIVHNGEFIRLQDGGDPIYFKINNEIHHIIDVDTLHALGGDFGLERTVTPQEFDTYVEKEEVTMDNYQKYV